MIYCMAGTKNTGDLRGSMIEPVQKTAESYHRHHTPVVGVLRGTTEHGYAGYNLYKRELMRRRVPDMAIIPIDLLPEDEVKKQLNTYTEAKALISYCGYKKVHAIYLVAPYFHQMRASTTIISNLDLENPELWIFNKAANPPPWNVPILHSQGVFAGTLSELEFSELDRLFEYHEKGFLVSCAEVMDYYEKRNKVFGL